MRIDGSHVVTVAARTRRDLGRLRSLRLKLERRRRRAGRASTRRHAARPGRRGGVPARELPPRSRRARLVIRDRSRHLTVQILEAGPEIDTTASDTEMNGVPCHRREDDQPSSRDASRCRCRSEAGRAGSTSPGSRRPTAASASRRSSSRPPDRWHRVAVVLPTLTWQAYNFRDDDGDGKADSWYAGKRLNTVRLGRAFLDRGVPYGFCASTSASCTGSHWTDKRVDVLSQWDLEHVREPTRARRAYDLIVFAGHHEYVTTREYDLVERLPRPRRQPHVPLGEQLLLAGRAARRTSSRRTRRWRDLGRPEAALIGVQYIAYQRSAASPWVVRRTPAATVAPDGNRPASGSPLGRGGVEIDHVTKASPARHPGARRDPESLRAGQDRADDLLRDERAERRVFAAGAFHFTRAITTRLRRLAAPRERLGQADAMTHRARRH